MVPGTEDLNTLSACSVTTPQPLQGWHGCSEGTGQQEGCPGDLAGRGEQASEHAAGSAGVLPAGKQNSSSCQLLSQPLHPGSSQNKGGAGPRSKHILTSRREEGGKAESRLSQQIPLSPSTSLPHPAVAHQEQGLMYHNADQDRRSTCQQAWPGMRGHNPCHGCSRTYKAGPTSWSSGFCTEEQQCLTYFTAEASSI